MKPLLFFVGVLMIFTATSYAKNAEQFSPEKNHLSYEYRHYIVSYVIDGDTFNTPQQRIRLWGIDAPEKDEPLYLQSRIALKTLIGRNRLECKFIEADHYNRAVMHCHINGEDLGGIMVKHGYARDYTPYSKGFYRREERSAKEYHAGMWK